MLIIPVMPNKEEAWRRFVQALQGSQSEAFTVWRHQLDLSVEQVWLCETAGGTAVILNLSIGDEKAVLARLAKMGTPFEGQKVAKLSPGARSGEGRRLDPPSPLVAKPAAVGCSC